MADDEDMLEVTIFVPEEVEKAPTCMLCDLVMKKAALSALMLGTRVEAVDHAVVRASFYDAINELLTAAAALSNRFKPRRTP